MRRKYDYRALGSISGLWLYGTRYVDAARRYLSDGDHELVVKAELPDMSREDIDITVENFVLTVKGEKKLSNEVKEEQYHHVERRYGTFSRSFSLPQTVDSNRVAAEYKNGVLTVRLPLREEAKPRTIKVDVAA
jgi:HSP20 family protein